MTPIRFKVLKYFLTAKHTVTLPELLDYFFSPSYKAIANKHITKVEEQGEYKKVYIKGIKNPFFYPKGFNAHSIHQVVVECFNPRNWHYYEIPETKVGVNDVVVDCGSAEGLFGLIVENRCKEVYLVEPLDTFVQALSKTFENSTNVRIIPKALSDSEFETKMVSNDISSSLSDEGVGETIHVTTLDKLFFDKGIKVDYIKIDLEGYDLNALVGAENLLKKNKPKIAVTTYHKKEHADQITQYLKTVVPEYNILTKGISQETGSPIMLHAWI